MKNLLLSLTSTLLTYSTNAQQDVSSLIEENRQLKQEVQSLRSQLREIDSCHFVQAKNEFCDAIYSEGTTTIKIPWEIYEIEVLSCTGERKEQSVTVILLLKNKSINQTVYIDKYQSSVIDIIGNSCQLNEVKIGSGNHTGTLYTDAPVRVFLTFTNVMPGTEKFNFLTFRMSSTPANTDQYIVNDKKPVEIRNLNIVW